MTTTGERVHWLREQRGWTAGQLVAQAQAAMAARGRAGEFSRSTLYRLERGERQPETATVVALADALQTSTDFLLGRTGDPAPAPVGALPAPAPDVVPLVERLNALDPARRGPLTAALLTLLNAPGAVEAPPERQQEHHRQRRGAPRGHDSQS
jgi:transcriptional regulator with XRE-family HTH domain